MKKNKIKICFVSADPNFLGGIALFQHNFINYLKQIKFPAEITWIYAGKASRNYEKDGVSYVSIKEGPVPLLNQVNYNLKVSNFLKKNYFDIVNTHASSIFWTNHYEKPENQRIIATYHGSSYYFIKNSLERFNILQKIALLPYLYHAYSIDKPSKEVDSLICVSEKVKNQIQRLYGKRDNLEVIRTGVDLKTFRPRNKLNARKALGLDKDKVYGLYVGRGGYWTKGFDRAIELGKEIYELNNQYRLIAIGPDLNKIKRFLDEDSKKFLVMPKETPREKMPYYYDSADIFFCLSRYEGGAPTLVTSEAMASGCLVVCSRSSQQEILLDGKNGLILNEDYGREASRIMNVIKNAEKRREIIKNSLKTVREFSIEKWGKRYLEVLLN